MEPEPLSPEARRTWNVVVALLGVAVLACVGTSTIERRGGSAWAPMNEQRGGSLRYYEGTKSRDDVYREMFQYCGGPYEIASERDVDRGMTTHYTRNAWTTSTTIEHVIDFRCVGQPQRAQASGVRLSGDEWRLSRDYVVQYSGCPTANVEHEVASPTPGAKGYAVLACGQKWLCSAGNGVAVCAVDGNQPPAQPAPWPQSQPPPAPPPDVSVPLL